MNFLRHLALSLVLGAPVVAIAQISIAMPPTINGGFVLNHTSQTIAWAQTFVAPDVTHTRLDHLEFRASNFNGISDFAAYVVQWDSASLALEGAPLWTSAIQSTLSLPAFPSSSVISFNTGGIDLQPGQAYALVFFDPTATSGTSPMAAIGLASPGSLSGSTYVLARSSATTAFSDLYDVPVSNYSNNHDVAFGATFSAPGLTAVPEPATAVAGLGLAFIACLVALRLQQRRRAATPAASSPA